MKKILVGLFLTTGIAVLATMSALAQGSFSYQVTLRDAKGHFISNDTVGMRFILMKDNVVCYEETQKTVTDAYGSVSVMVGEGIASLGDMEDVPWSSGGIMMKVELDTECDGSYVDLAEMQIQPVPYALYAASADLVSEIVAGAGTDPNEPLFSVKDKDGNIVFAVYRDGVQIFVDDSTSAGKAMSRGFAISERKASKSVDDVDLFVVDASGTQVYVNSGSSKAMSRGFAISERKASKDADDVDLFVVDANGTQVYVGSDSGKAMSRGFAISERKASKGDDDLNLITVNSDGTQVFVSSDTKAMSRGFAISERKASKDDDDENLFIVDADGTQVYIKNDESKAMSRGFAISERKASKDADDADFLVVGAAGTQVYVGNDESKAMSRGFAISERKASKSDGSDNLFVVDDNGTQIMIDGSSDKAMSRGFAISGRNLTKDGETKNYLLVTDTVTSFSINDSVNTGFAIVNLNNGDTMMAVAAQNVDFGAPLKVVGDIVHNYIFDTLPDTLCVAFLQGAYYVDIDDYVSRYFEEIRKYDLNDVVQYFLHGTKWYENSLTVENNKFSIILDDDGKYKLAISSSSCVSVTDSLSLSFVVPNVHEYKLLPLKLVCKPSLSNDINLPSMKYGVITYDIKYDGVTSKPTRYSYVDEYGHNENVLDYELNDDKYVCHDYMSELGEHKFDVYKFSDGKWVNLDGQYDESIISIPKLLSGFIDLDYLGNVDETLTYVKFNRQIGGNDYTMQMNFDNSGDFGSVSNTYCNGILMDYSTIESDKYRVECKSVDFNHAFTGNGSLLDFYKNINPDF